MAQRFSTDVVAAAAAAANFSVHLNGSHLDVFNGTFLLVPENDYFGDVLYCAVVPFLFGLVTLTGVIGNSLVIYVICSKQKMRTLTNLLLLNLAFADLSFVLICPPFTAYEFATYHWPFSGVLGDVVCKLMHYLLNVTAYVTIYTLVLIAALRYFTIVHNSATVKYRTKRVVALLVCGIWVVMLLVNAPIVTSYGVQVNLYGVEDCENYGRQVGQYIYATFFVFAYLLPLAVIGLFSLGILLHINGGGSKHNRRSVGVSRSEFLKKHASRLIIAVVVMFAIFWFPVHVHLLLAYFGRVPDTNWYRAVSVLFNFLAYFNSCVNPIVYNCTSKDFQLSFREAVCCRRRPSPSSADVPLVTLQKRTNEINGNSKAGGCGELVVVVVTSDAILPSPSSVQLQCL